MTFEKNDNHHESQTRPPLYPSVLETFFDDEHKRSGWLEDLSKNEEFLRQVEERSKLIKNLNDLFGHLPTPDMSIEDAFKEGHITADQIQKTYESLSSLLKADEGYERIVLYLPFELLPNVNWHPDEITEKVLEDFRISFMEVWKKLLSIQDVRANFVDGDIPETSQQIEDLSRVVKAAHLIPKLVEKGLITIKEVIGLIERSDDDVLKNSIADTLPVLADMGLISEADIENMENSGNQLIKAMGKIIKSQREKPDTEVTPKTVTCLEVEKELEEKIKEIDSEDYSEVTKSREKWLRKIKKERTINELAGQVKSSILSQTLNPLEFEILTDTQTKPEVQQVFINGIRMTIESLASDDLEQAKSLYAKHEDRLLTIWKNGNPENRLTLSKTFRILEKLDIVDENFLLELGINIPKLEGPFSQNLRTDNKEVEGVRNSVRSMETSPELSKLIYPVTLIFGSQLKGYGEEGADLDIAVFVRPETPQEDKDRLKVLLKEKFNQDVAQIWLEEKGNSFVVKNFDKQDPLLAEDYWTHVFFGSVWTGDENIIVELQKKLLTPYLHKSDQEIFGQKARSIYIEQLERDNLQYRLMHKGYERFYPRYGGIKTKHSDDVDGNSMFWDSGYRQLATKLFASRVFLPKL